MRKNKLIWLLALVQLSGCASYSNDFACKAGKGVGCKSISQVNEMINENAITEENVKPHEAEKEHVFNYLPASNPSAKSKVLRIPEKTMRIWVNSFTDEKGDFIEETYLHTVVESGKWVEN